MKRGYLDADRISLNGRTGFRVRSFAMDGARLKYADDITDFDRRKTRLEMATAIVADNGWSQVEASEVVLDLYNRLMDAEDSSPPSDDGAKRSQASTLVDLAQGVELWHTLDGATFATVAVDGHRETWSLRAKSFKEWLAFRFFQAEGKSPGGQAVADAVAVLGGKALFEGSEDVVYTRIADVDGVIYLDLANDGWEVVEVTAAGWQVTHDAPVRFRRPRGMLALPTPIQGGDVNLLRGFLNLETEDDWALYAGCQVQAFRGRGPYPVLVFYGEHGAAKSTTERVFRRSIDPNRGDLRAPPRDERDLRIQATNGWVVCYDNLTALPEWLSNALCRLSTGGGMGTRELFSDDDEIIFEGQRPIVLNGIEEISSRPDLLDRSVFLLLKPIPRKDRRPERAFWAAFDGAHPSILGGLLDAVVAGLQHERAIRLDDLPRMADFALWATACEPGLGLPPGAFMRAYIANRAEANSSAIEGAIIGPYLQQMMADLNVEEWTGTATELLTKLNALAPEAVQKQKEWPKRANILSGKLRGLAPNLREEGMEVHQGRENGRSKISLFLRLNAENTATTATSPPTAGVGGGGGGGDGGESDDLHNYSNVSKKPWGACDCPTPDHFGPGEPQPVCDTCGARTWCRECGGCVGCQLEVRDGGT